MKLLSFEDIIKKTPEEIDILLAKCSRTPQSPNWHPEGDCLKHIQIVYERARKTGELDYILAALFHDLGKVKTTKLNSRGSWGSHGHEFESARILERHKDWVEEMGGNYDRIHSIVFNHMRFKHMDEMKKPKREHFMKNQYFKDFEIFAEFDNMKTLTPEELV
jgi:hypothetical protein